MKKRSGWYLRSQTEIWIEGVRIPWMFKLETGNYFILVKWKKIPQGKKGLISLGPHEIVAVYFLNFFKLKLLTLHGAWPPVLRTRVFYSKEWASQVPLKLQFECNASVADFIEGRSRGLYGLCSSNQISEVNTHNYINSFSYAVRIPSSTK